MAFQFVFLFTTISGKLSHIPRQSPYSTAIQIHWNQMLNFHWCLYLLLLHPGFSVLLYLPQRDGVVTTDTLSSSQCCIFPVESLLVTLPGCPICAFVKYSSLAASITLETIRNGTNTQGFCWLLKVILPFRLNEVMATVGLRAMQGQN